MYRDNARRLGDSSFVLNSITVVLSLTGLILSNTLKFPLHESGFFCDDETIRFPYRSSTVSVTALFLISATPAIAAIILGAVLNCTSASQQQGGLSSSANVTDSRAPGTWKSVLTSAVVQIFVLIFGFAMTTILTEMLKCSMGRLRPNFLDVCRLQPGSFNCSEGQGYVTVYNCTQPYQFLLADARKSFLSGHSSISFYFLVFTALYIGYNVPRSYYVFKSALQVLCLGTACYVGVSRITDYKHHPTDVIAGALLGSFFGAITARRMMPEASKTNTSDADASVQLRDVKANQPSDE